LSGGQRQRVAMGRAIVRDPQVFLFDEPLSNLDAKLRVQMRLEIKRLQKRLGVTSLYVTHDQVEAMTIGDRLMVLNGGYVEQFGAPTDLYERPANIFVASFIGSPAMNLLEVEAGDGIVTLPSGGTLPYSGGKRGRITFGVRPEHLIEGDGPLELEVAMQEQLGATTLVHCELPDGGAVVASLPGLQSRKIGSKISFAPMDGKLHFFDADGIRID